MNFLFSSIIASVAEKNLPNGTKTLGNLKTADYELRAVQPHTLFLNRQKKKLRVRLEIDEETKRQT